MFSHHDNIWHQPGERPSMQYRKNIMGFMACKFKFNEPLLLCRKAYLSDGVLYCVEVAS
jgi:hypothetical protein